MGLERGGVVIVRLRDIVSIRPWAAVKGDKGTELEITASSGRADPAGVARARPQWQAHNNFHQDPASTSHGGVLQEGADTASTSHGGVVQEGAEAARP